MIFSCKGKRCGSNQNMKKIVAIIILLMFNIGAYADVQNNAQSDDACYVLLEAETGKFLVEKNSDMVMPIGTLTKLMTQLIVAENIENGKITLDTLVTASSNVFGMKGASIWLAAGEQMSVKDLLKASIIGNANDATAALAENIGGNQQKFLDLMNTRAAELNMKNTIFTDCTGLDSGNISTAIDIGLLSRELVKHKILTPFMTTWRDFIRDDTKQSTNAKSEIPKTQAELLTEPSTNQRAIEFQKSTSRTEIVNENTLVKSFSGITGLKAGRAGDTFNLVLSAERDSKTYIAVVLNTDKDERFSRGKELINSGFANYTVMNPYFSSEFLKPVKVKKGIETAVEIEPLELQSLLVSRGNADEITTEIFLPEYINAPVKKGQKIGIVAFYINDTLLYETPLITKNSIEVFTYKKAFFKLLESILS
ncbi:D-alanyl-D-alanine carboxypeptidase [Clostridia bacterium]|nr:D-alanyl-D-alanine carboxypeptidase [Clostridia bacterium]